MNAVALQLVDYKGIRGKTKDVFRVAGVIDRRQDLVVGKMRGREGRVTVVSHRDMSRAQKRYCHACS